MGLLSPENAQLWIIALVALIVHRLVRFFAMELESALERQKLLEAVVEKRLDYLQRMAERGLLDPKHPLYRKLVKEANTPDGFDVDIIDEAA